MARLEDMVSQADQLLRTGAVEDYPGAHNGLQVANGGEVRRLLAAVDASLPVLCEAATRGADSLLIVHHGLFWAGVQRVTGIWKQKLDVMRGAGMAVYSAHLPLDAHATLGNNVLLSKAVGLRGLKPFLGFGWRGGFSGSREGLVKAVARATGRAPQVCAAGPSRPRRIGVVTGGGGDLVEKAAEAGVDTFLTGEGPQWSWVRAEELQINVIYAGHYATETFGVKALASHLARKFRVPWEFVDHYIPL